MNTLNETITDDLVDEVLINLVTKKDEILVDCFQTGYDCLSCVAYSVEVDFKCRRA